MKLAKETFCSYTMEINGKSYQKKTENDSEALKGIIENLKMELEQSKQIRKNQELKFQRLIATVTKKFREKEDEVKKHLEFKHKQLTSILQALYVFESKLRQEKKLLINLLEQKDKIMKLQTQEITKLKRSLNELRNIEKNSKQIKNIENYIQNSDDIPTSKNNFNNYCKPDLISCINIECGKSVSEFESVSKKEYFGNQNIDENTYLISSLDTNVISNSKSILHVRRSSTNDPTISIPFSALENSKAPPVPVRNKAKKLKKSINLGEGDNKLEIIRKPVKVIQNFEILKEIENETKNHSIVKNKETYSITSSSSSYNQNLLEMAKISETTDSVRKQEYNIDKKYKKKYNSICKENFISTLNNTNLDDKEIIDIIGIKNDEDNKKCNKKYYPSLPPKPINIDKKTGFQKLEKSILEVTVRENDEYQNNGLYVVSNSALSDEDTLKKLDILNKSKMLETPKLEGIDVQFFSANNKKLSVCKNNNENLEITGDSKIVQTVSTLLLDPNESDNETETNYEKSVETQSNSPNVLKIVKKFENIMFASIKGQEMNNLEENSDMCRNFEEFHLVDNEIESTCKGKVKENARLEADGEENQNNNDVEADNTKYEHFLEATGLSQKSILTPSRILSNHRNVTKPKDIKYRNRIKAANINEKFQDNNLLLGSTVKYWTEPYL